MFKIKNPDIIKILIDESSFVAAVPNIQLPPLPPTSESPPVPDELSLPPMAPNLLPYYPTFRPPGQGKSDNKGMRHFHC